MQENLMLNADHDIEDLEVMSLLHLNFRVHLHLSCKLKFQNIL